MIEDYSEESITKHLQDAGYQEIKEIDYLGSFTIGTPSTRLFWKNYSCYCAIRIGMNIPIKPLDRIIFHIVHSERLIYGEIPVNIYDNFIELIKRIELIAQNYDRRSIR